jgi:hypothetical protein
MTNKKRDFVIVRTYSAGVFAGTLVQRHDKEVELKGARRIWYWDGAASLSQMALEGVSKPQNCKFAVPVNVTVTEAIEILSTTKKAQKNILAVPAWRQ